MAKNIEEEGRSGEAVVGGGGGRAGGKGSDSGEVGKRADRGSPTPGAGDGRTPGNGEPSLRKDLRDFASGRPQGWGHDDWVRFLEDLQSRGHDIRDREAIGIALEKERLDVALTPLRGMGPQRRAALVERFGTVWNLRNADVGEIARTAKVPRDLAERVKAELS